MGKSIKRTRIVNKISKFIKRYSRQYKATTKRQRYDGDTK